MSLVSFFFRVSPLAIGPRLVGVGDSNLVIFPARRVGWYNLRPAAVSVPNGHGVDADAEEEQETVARLSRSNSKAP
jgi:hypothetical protein